MVASIAHEINNPLQSIKNCLFLIQHELHEGPVLEYLNMASSETSRISNLVSQLRDIYRPTKLEQAKRLNLRKLLNEVHALLIPHLQYQQVEWIQVGSCEGMEIKVIADQIKQVFLNISLNAIEAMQPDGGSLTISFLHLEHLAHKDRAVIEKGPYVGIAFKDTGPGIAEENLNKIFEPFFTTKETGTGLGLAICYDIVKRNNGEITIESQVDQGATFTVWLPLVSWQANQD
jgi:signal transduction histidine kinase